MKINEMIILAGAALAGYVLITSTSGIKKTADSAGSVAATTAQTYQDLNAPFDTFGAAFNKLTDYVKNLNIDANNQNTILFKKIQQTQAQQDQAIAAAKALYSGGSTQQSSGGSTATPKTVSSSYNNVNGVVTNTNTGLSYSVATPNLNKFIQSTTFLGSSTGTSQAIPKPVNSSTVSTNVSKIINNVMSPQTNVSKLFSYSF